MNPTVKKVGMVIGLVILAILPGGFLLFALAVAGVKIFKKGAPDPKKLVIGQRRVVVNDATGLDYEPMGWVGREFIIVGPGEYDGFDAEVRWLSGKGCNGPNKDRDDLGYTWISNNTQPVE